MYLEVTVKNSRKRLVFNENKVYLGQGDKPVKNSISVTFDDFLAIITRMSWWFDTRVKVTLEMYGEKRFHWQENLAVCFQFPDGGHRDVSLEEFLKIPRAETHKIRTLKDLEKYVPEDAEAAP